MFGFGLRHSCWKWFEGESCVGWVALVFFPVPHVLEQALAIGATFSGCWSLHEKANGFGSLVPRTRTIKLIAPLTIWSLHAFECQGCASRQ